MMRLFRAICRVLAASAVFLAFPACDGAIADYYAIYGKPADFQRADEIAIHGRVVERDTDKPIKGIAIYIQGITAHYAHLTDDKGEFSFPVPPKEGMYVISCIDIDGNENGRYGPEPPYTYSRDRVENSYKVPLEFELTLLP